MRMRGGSVFQRSSDSRWVAIVTIPMPRGEPRRRVTRYAKTREEAESHLAALRAEHAITVMPAIPRKDRLVQARELGIHTPREWAALRKANGWVCYYCGAPPAYGRVIPMDHMIPLSRGGSDAIDNLTTCCKRCNSQKQTLTADEFLAIKSREERHADQARERRGVDLSAQGREVGIRNRLRALGRR